MRESTRNEENRGVLEEAGGASEGPDVGKPQVADGGEESPASGRETSLEEVLLFSLFEAAPIPLA